MPELVVLPSDKKKSSGNSSLDLLFERSREAHRYVERFARAHYTRTAYDDGEFLVLARASRTSRKEL
jgi:hypothetical protein